MPPKRPSEDPLDPYRAELERLARPAVRLARASQKTNCHLGGLPRVPASFVWPSNKEGRPLGFLAQLDLAEVRAAAEIEWLPKAGTLLFFYDVIEEPWGHEPEDRGGWKVIYLDEGRALAEATAPEAPQRTYESTRLSIMDPEVLRGLFKDPRGLLKDPRRILEARNLVKVTKETHSETVDVVFDRFDLEPSTFKSFPSFEDRAMRAVWPKHGLEAEAVKEAYGEFRAEELPRPQHQMEGYPVTVQAAEIEAEAHLAFQGVGDEDLEEMSRSRREQLLTGHEEWRLLLQLDSDEDGPGWMWGDSGLLYFLVRRDDARRGNFDDVWVILQCF